MTFVIVMGFHQIIVVMNDVKRHTYTYINDLFPSIRFSDVHHFADDTNLINISGSLKQLAKQMNLDLRFLSQRLLMPIRSL